MDTLRQFSNRCKKGQLLVIYRQRNQCFFFKDYSPKTSKNSVDFLVNDQFLNFQWFLLIASERKSISGEFFHYSNSNLEIAEILKTIYFLPSSLIVGLQRRQIEMFGFTFSFITWYFKKPWKVNKNTVLVNSGSSLGRGISSAILSGHVMQ